jgi:hypothetical protein
MDLTKHTKTPCARCGKLENIIPSSVHAALYRSGLDQYHRDKANHVLTVTEALESLVAKSLAFITIDPDGVRRYRLTPAGRALTESSGEPFDWRTRQ